MMRKTRHREHPVHVTRERVGPRVAQLAIGAAIYTAAALMLLR
jgi:hypothetical protein